MSRIRSVGWAGALLAILVFAGGLWARDLIGHVAAIATLTLGLVTADPGATPAPPLHDGWEAVVTIGLIVLWIVLTLVVPRHRFLRPLGINGSFGASSAVLATLGIVTFVVLLFASIVPIRMPGLLMVGTAVGILAVLVVLRRLPEEARASVGSGDSIQMTSAPWPVRQLILLVTGVSLAMLVLVIARDIAYLAFFRPDAGGDEAYFWWRSTAELYRLGYYDYMSSFDVAGYLPGYPLLGNFLLGWVPETLFPAAGRALPFLFGFSALWIVLRGTITRRNLLSPIAGVYYILGYVLLFNHTWIHSLFFELWYGEAFATVIFALILILLDHARRETSGAPAGALLGLFGFGLGSLAVLTKPPLSFLLLPAILPTLIIAGVLSHRARGPVRPFLITAAAVALGGFLTQSLWGAQLGLFGRASVYSIDIGALLAFKPEGSFSKLVPYVIGGYKEVWVLFILTTVLAFAHDWRRFLPFWLVSLGMVGSVFILYLGQWSTVEHESGARYILHGAYGWILFALGALGPSIARTVSGWTSRSTLLDVRRRLSTRNAAP